MPATGRRNAPPTTGRASSRCFRGLRARSRKWPADLEQVRLWYEPHLERIHEDATTRRADLLQLEQIASGYASRERFLTELTLDPPDATSDQAGPPHRDEDYLILSTIHSAKGQEWKNVFVLNTVDGCIPIDLGVGTKEDIDEERRLLYVAMTRAKDSLHLVTPQRFFHPWPGGARRPPCLCLAHPLHPGLDPRRLRADVVGKRPCKGRSAPSAASSRRPRRPHARHVEIALSSEASVPVPDHVVGNQIYSISSQRTPRWNTQDTREL